MFHILLRKAFVAACCGLVVALISQSAHAQVNQITGSVGFEDRRYNGFEGLHMTLIAPYKWDHQVVSANFQTMYFFQDPNPGSYTIKPFRSGYRFSPPSARVDHDGGRTTFNFTQFKLKGDLNCDDRIDADDYFLFIDVYNTAPVTTIGYRDCDSEGADMNSDNAIDENDVWPFYLALISSKDFVY